MILLLDTYNKRLEAVVGGKDMPLTTAHANLPQRIIPASLSVIKKPLREQNPISLIIADPLHTQQGMICHLNEKRKIGLKIN